MYQRKQAETGISVGASSILVIFVVLALTTFATLSLVSANSDYRLTMRTVRATTAYYEADARAVEAVNALRGAMAGKTAEELSALAPELGWTVLDSMAYFATPIDEVLELQVTADITGGGLRLVQWQAVNTVEWEDEQPLGLWDGGAGMGEPGLAVPPLV